jgi:hypothetical protein
MSVVPRVSIAALFSTLLFSLTSVVIGMPEDSRLEAWLAVPPRQAGIVLSIDFPVALANISSGGKILAVKKWIPKVPFIWQLRVPPDVYQIHFEHGPIWSVGVIAKQPASLTYVRLTAAGGKDGDVGVGVTVTAGAPPSELSNLLQNAAKIGISDAWNTDYIDASYREDGARVLLVSTEPPWPIPPPPPKR